MKFLLLLASILIYIVISLSSFIFLLYTFHSPFGYDIVELKAHNLTWTYLIKQKYISFIDLDIFSIHEKRHLLDVKRLFSRIYEFWIISSVVSILLLTFFYLKCFIREVFRYVIYIGVFINSLLVISSLFFRNSFELLHRVLFPVNSWIFPENSILIKWFPLEYFVEFFLLYIFLNTTILYFLKIKTTKR
jgi:hypothetical protein